MITTCGPTSTTPYIWIKWILATTMPLRNMSMERLANNYYSIIITLVSIIHEYR